MRMIDGDALCDWLKDYGRKVIKGERPLSLMYVWKHIRDMPSPEPEIIYCKDCRHHGTAICRIWSRYGTINTPDYGFCFRGERKTDD
jgi:hypothetical protein